MHPLFAWLVIAQMDCAWCSTIYDYDSWTISSNLMPRRARSMAVGNLSDTIHLYGSWQTQQSHITYDTTLGTFTDLGETELDPLNVYGNTQFFAQIEATMYWLDYDDKSQIVTYDMSADTYSKTSVPDLPTSPGWAVCLTYSQNDDVLFVLGGYNNVYLTSVYALDVGNAEWFDDISPMSTRRGKGGCIVDPITQTLLAIGGATSSSAYTDTVEKVLVSDLLGGSGVWGYLSASLPYAYLGMGVIYTVDGIILLGGYEKDAADSLTNVIRIDVEAETITTVGYLAQAAFSAAPIRVGDTVYLFGGKIPGSDADNYLDTLQILDLTTRSPSKEPTSATASPSTDPTEIPTREPSRGPTEIPTSSPSTETPTRTPTTEPTLIWTTKPTAIPSTEPTVVLQDSDLTTTAPSLSKSGSANIEDGDALDVTTSHLLLIAALVVLLLIALAGYIDAKCFRRNDFFTIGALIVASVRVIDLYTDVLVAVDMHSSDEHILSMAVLVFVAVPALLSLAQLYCETKKWRGSEELDLWLAGHSKSLFLASALTGSAFTGVRLSHSNLFRLSRFDIPLSRERLRKFQNKELFSTVLLENIPQLAIQMYFLSLSLSDDDVTVYVSMLFSGLSAVAVISGICFQRGVVRSTAHVAVQFEVVDAEIGKEHSRRVRGIKHGLAALWALSPRLVEVRRPTLIRDGMLLSINVYRNLGATLDDAKQSGAIAEVIRAAWKLQNVPLIRELKVERHESKERRQNVEAHVVELVDSSSPPVSPMSVDSPPVSPRKQTIMMQCRNPLVLVIGISEYDELDNLKGVEKDVAAYEELWRNVYGYDVIIDLEKRHWTYDEIVDFIEVGRESLFDGAELLYDAFIVVVCGHGLNEVILPSDYSKEGNPTTVAIRKLHGKVSGFWSERVAQIPRLFVVDCCRGALRGGNVKRAADVGGHTADLLYTIYGNSPGIEVGEDKDGGLFSQVFAQAMRDNAERGRTLFSVQRAMKTKLKSKSGGDQLTVGDGDTDVQAVVFVPKMGAKISGRGAGGRTNAVMGGGQRRYKCDHDGCKKSYRSLAALKVHKKRQHGDSAEEGAGEDSTE